MSNRTLAVQIKLAQRARRAAQRLRDNEHSEHPHHRRHLHVRIVRRYLKHMNRPMFPTVWRELQTALQEAAAADERHWSDWDKPWREPDYEAPGTRDLIEPAMRKLHAAERTPSWGRPALTASAR